MTIKKVGILYHPRKEAAYALAEKLNEFLTSRGISAWMCSAWEGEQAKARLNGTDLILSIGGDGTILRAAEVAVTGEIPIIGINLGRLGFMTELGADEAVQQLPALLAGQGWIDERAMLEVELGAAGRISYALNDVVVARGGITRLISIEASINGERLTAYRADGVIVATATGSTGYALAAGGPILHPRAKEFLLLPIVPHLSSAYALVLPPTATVGLGVSTSHQATLSIDGHINLPLSSGSVVTVKPGARTVRFLRIHHDTFYSSLEQRLKGNR